MKAISNFASKGKILRYSILLVLSCLCFTNLIAQPGNPGGDPDCPVVHTVGGGGNVCTGGTGATITLSSSDGDWVEYQLKNGGANVGPPILGTGAALNWTNITTAGTYSIVAFSLLSSCTVNMTGSSMVAVVTGPTSYSMGGGGAYCAGGTGLSVTLSGSQTGVNYQLKINGVNSGALKTGTGSALTWGNQTAAGTYTVEAIHTTNGCVKAMTGTTSITINPLPVPTFTSAPASVCSGSTGNVYATQPGMTNYVWVVSAGGTVTAGGTTTSNSVTVTWNSAGSRTVSIKYTNANGCIASPSVVQNVTVNPSPVPTFTPGPDNALIGSTGNVYTTETGMSGYIWAVSAGGTITSGGTSTSSSVTVTWNATGPQSVSVRYTNGNGCVASVPTVKNITVNAAGTYQATWTDLVGVVLNPNNSLTKTTGTIAWDGGAVSYNVLNANTDAWIEFTIPPTGLSYVIGLARYNKEEVYSSIDFSLYMANGTMYAYESGVNKQNFGAYAAGDVMRISREGTNIKYYKNGGVIRTIVTDPNNTMRLDVSIYNAATVPSITCSFDKKLILNPTFVFPDYQNNNGVISLTVEGGDAPYTYAWSGGGGVPHLSRIKHAEFMELL